MLRLRSALLACALLAAAPAQQSKPCKPDAIHRSKCMIELILADIERTHGGIEQGGISGIAQQTSTSYTVSLPREEAVDLITYSFAFRGGAVSITGKTFGTKSYGAPTPSSATPSPPR